VPAGGTLEVLATDPDSVAGMAFCRTTGNGLLESTKDGDVFRFVITPALAGREPLAVGRNR
jgi:tRNA 2-thiouridine synthesizing protein A